MFVVVAMQYTKNQLISSILLIFNLSKFSSLFDYWKYISDMSSHWITNYFTTFGKTCLTPSPPPIFVSHFIMTFDNIRLCNITINRCSFHISGFLVYPFWYCAQRIGRGNGLYSPQQLLYPHSPPFNICACFISDPFVCISFSH